jgi:putative addiction module antidote
MLEHLLEHHLMTGAIAMKVKVQKIGNSLGVILPKEVLARMHISHGDELLLAESPNGISISAYSERTVDQLEIARSIMTRRRNVLKALAE